jgi:hypothetical protein
MPALRLRILPTALCVRSLYMYFSIKTPESQEKIGLRTQSPIKHFAMSGAICGSILYCLVSRKSAQDCRYLGPRRHYNVHFKCVFFPTQKLLPFMNDGGRIVNIATALTRIAMPGSCAYASVKGLLKQ